MFIRIFKYSIKNILRNKFLSFSSVLVFILLMFFINILLVVHNVSFKLIDSINSKMSISLYLKDNYDKNSLDVIKFINNLKNISGWIEVEYKDKDKLLEEVWKTDPKLVWILENENPLPNSIFIWNIWLEQYPKVNIEIQKNVSIIDNFSGNDDNSYTNYKEQYSRILKVISILNILKISLYVVIAIFLLSISIIVYSIIWNFIYYYRDEIYITNLVWWSKFFIYGPFVLQWMIYTLISFIFSAVLFKLLINNINFIIWYDNSLDFILENIYYLFFYELIIFMFIWAFSWYMSSKKYVN